VAVAVGGAVGVRVAVAVGSGGPVGVDVGSAAPVGVRVGVAAGNTWMVVQTSSLSDSKLPARSAAEDRKQ
jgi:hypothetical protein